MTAYTIAICLGQKPVSLVSFQGVVFHCYNKGVALAQIQYMKQTQPLPIGQTFQLVEMKEVDTPVQPSTN